ncbi:asparagine synthase [Sphingobium chlorophenolicum L-1]|uniref:Asparagine synthase n=1 Tax=Sphingobium chlorophenolicum L-1 TaxID=690566 RepID=F6F0N6_SPHCR|nr:asparagine synthase C-terminal domain-containing protein [Sphingobium chlorophenolicum]AEG50358.1 asparagine synthase [Sphingobium chlorophenolicum L-1]
MTPYLILSWRAGDAPAEALVRQLRPLSSGWRLLVDRPGHFIAIGGDGLATRAGPHETATFIVGDLFARDGRSGYSGGYKGLPGEDVPFADLCDRLSRDHWGAYLAVRLGPDGEMSLFRDPIGMLDGLIWQKDGLSIVASRLMPWVEICAPSHLAIDWGRIAQLLFDSATLAEETALIGVGTIPPGSILDVRQGQMAARRLWQPSTFHDRQEAEKADAAPLRATVEQCVQAWTGRYAPTMLEISGGLDSAIVAAAGTSAGPGIKWGIHFFAGQLSGDERRFARAISAQTSIALDEVFMPVGQLGEEDLEDLPVDARPGLASASLFHDRALARIALDRGAMALFTGHGGDSLFFQHPTPLIAGDPSFPRFDMGAYAALAKWSRTSVWTVARHAFHLPMPRRAAGLADEALAALPIHLDGDAPRSQWAGELDALPPAKRVHVAAIATDRSVICPSWRSRSLTVVHPLLSQPLVEWAIAADAYQLTLGRRDRMLARQAFAGLLPSSVVERRGKGVLAQYFGQCLCASVHFLRTFLLDGVLVGNGVLDGKRLAPMLDEDFLMRFDCYAKLRSVILMEHWARVWQGRLEAIRAARKALFAAGS